MYEPITFLNSTLQGDFKHSLNTAMRFSLNSTLGVAGIFDIAEKEGLKHRREDFGQTLGRYNIAAGPYIILPVYGPSNVRDTVGFVVNIFSDPFYYLFDDRTNIAYNALIGLDQREALLDITDDLEQLSLDEYAATRSAYSQSLSLIHI